MIEPLFLNCTRIPLGEKDALLAQGPKEAKAHIALDIVRRFHGEAAANSAKESWSNTFSKGGVPDDVQEISLLEGVSLADALVVSNVVPSKTEWRRLIDGGGVKLEDDTKITDPNFKPSKGTILKIGKRRFVKVV